jgi:hypothetical protein
MEKRTVKIIIDKKGNHTIIAGEEMTGTSCTEKTRQLELVLGGTEISSGKTDKYYDGDDSPVSINITD